MNKNSSFRVAIDFDDLLILSSSPGVNKLSLPFEDVECNFNNNK